MADDIPRGPQLGIKGGVSRQYVAGVSLPPQPLGAPRDAGGRFESQANIENALKGVYRRYQDMLHAKVVENVAEELSRRPRTGRLVRATADKRNVLIGDGGTGRFGFGVGNPKWLDKSEARYWRIVEEGSEVAAPRWKGPMVDKQGIPLFGSWAPGPKRFKPFPSRSGPGKLRPYSVEARVAILEEGKRRIPVRTTEITPRSDYLRAWREIMGADAKVFFADLRRALVEQAGLSRNRAASFVRAQQSFR